MQGSGGFRIEFGRGTWRARGARAYNGGLGAEPPAGSRGRAPGGGSGGRSPPEAESFLALERPTKPQKFTQFFVFFFRNSPRARALNQSG